MSSSSSSSSTRKRPLLWTVIGLLLIATMMVLQSLKMATTFTMMDTFMSYNGDEPTVPALVECRKEESSHSDHDSAVTGNGNMWNYKNNSNNDTSLLVRLYETNKRPSMARNIVEHSFRTSFVQLTSKCSNVSTPIVRCCRQESYPNTPWWFQTMMRDFRWTAPWHTQSAYHVLPPTLTSSQNEDDNNDNGTTKTKQRHTNTSMGTNDGAVQMCAMEKIGMKHWKELFCVFQNSTAGGGTRPSCHPKPQVPSTAPKFVFLRDPLERFLSAFIDKCITARDRNTGDKANCEPSIIFTNPNNTGTFLGPKLRKDKRALFEAYVSAMPLKWDIHFFPQSLYCEGLYRHLHTYDFIGRMDSNFYIDLQRLGQRYGQTFRKGLDKVFDLPTKLQKQQQQQQDEANTTVGATTATAALNKGIETSASTHVLEYYSPRTVRLVLEYMAIDYALLGLPIPTWAERMLLLEQDDDEQQQQLVGQ